MKNNPSFDDRLTRIRASLEKINRLMAELKFKAQQDSSHPQLEPEDKPLCPVYYIARRVK
jgi:hypothetical protein